MSDSQKGSPHFMFAHSPHRQRIISTREPGGCKAIQIYSLQEFFGWPPVAAQYRGTGSWVSPDDLTEYVDWLNGSGAVSWMTFFGINPSGLVYPAQEVCAGSVPTRRSKQVVYRYDGFFVADLGDGEQIYAAWHEITFTLDSTDGFLVEVHYANSCGLSYNFTKSTITGDETLTGDEEVLDALDGAGVLSTCGQFHPGLTDGKSAEWSANASGKITVLHDLYIGEDAFECAFVYEFRWDGFSGSENPSEGGWSHTEARQEAVDRLAVFNLAARSSTIAYGSPATNALKWNARYIVVSSTSNVLFPYTPTFPKQFIVIESLFEDLFPGTGFNGQTIDYGLYHFEGITGASGFSAIAVRAQLSGDHHQTLQREQTPYIAETESSAGVCPEFDSEVCTDNPFATASVILGPEDTLFDLCLASLIRDTFTDVGTIGETPRESWECITSPFDDCP